MRTKIQFQVTSCSSTCEQVGERGEGKYNRTAADAAAAAKFVKAQRCLVRAREKKMSQSREPFNTQHELANLRKLKSDIEASANEEEIFEHEVSRMAVIENACAGQKRMEV